ncbi:hypothetical protein [Ectothiorhodospira sp. BSL-9]|jgi:hypothetical protein|uniref:hypothetical protein n=1 Tax=Ectothiorhodospira sp. BSL-9 TaxID=1442136 RepID=UPI0007B435C0|nr:hypothetical protein [Ectothiorhodospira sp. BSL-9]ANB01757.1 hypothetical protein ECTOBSL9_0936 [Ectothiorhodospira sp. BSL-9]TVQ75076.1 MAG: hypothetical protein EA372_00840 [Chromatiaceae bacterium]
MSQPAAARHVSARACAGSAKLFNYGTIIAVTVAGVPLFLVTGEVGVATIIAAIMGIVPLVLWFGGSMLVYALNRHHPDERVGYYTQQAAYRYYAFMGALIVIGTFFPPEIFYFRIYWLVAALIIIPWSIRDIIRINREHWQDVEIPKEPDHG